MANWKLLVSAVVLAMAASAKAQVPQSLSCLKGAPERQLECVSAAFSKSEALLNETYNSILANLAGKTEFGNDKNFLLENMRSRLRISQRAWVYFRESQCEMEAFGLMDSQHVTATHIVCQTRMNNERVVVLQNYFRKFTETTIPEVR